MVYEDSLSQVKFNLSILFKSKEKQSSSDLNEKIKIYAFDDKTLNRLGREELTLRKWIELLEAIATHKPAAIYIDKVFSTPVFDIEPEVFYGG